MIIVSTNIKQMIKYYQNNKREVAGIQFETTVLGSWLRTVVDQSWFWQLVYAAVILLHRLSADTWLSLPTLVSETPFWHLHLTFISDTCCSCCQQSCAMFCYTVLYYTVLCCSDLLYVVLFYNVLYCTALFCAEMCSGVLWCVVL